MRLWPFLVVLMMLSAAAKASVDDSLPQGINSRFLVFPFFLRSPETSWGFGGAGAFFFKAKKNEENLRTSDVNLIALYTLRKQTVIVLGSSIFFPGEKKIFRFQTSYSYYPDKFWGLGNNSPESAKHDYALKQVFFNPQFIMKTFRKFYTGLTMEFQDVTEFTFDQGATFDNYLRTGKLGGFASGAGLLLTWDTRNNAYSPSKGALAELNFTIFSETFASDYNFINHSIDFRKFIAIGRNRVLATQVYNRVVNGTAPLRYHSMLGGPEIMRGYYKGRYTDQNLFAVQGEVRQYLFWRLGVAGFAAAGQVGESIESYGLDKFHFSYGGGIRLLVHEKEKLNLRVDFGFGKNSSGIYVILKEAF